MIELLKSIQAYVAADASGPLMGVATGGFHLLVAPATAITDYVVITPVSAPLTTVYKGPAYADIELQFAAYGTNVKTAQIIAAVVAVFDAHTFTLAAGQNFHSQRTTAPMPMGQLPESDQQGRPVYGWMVSYLFSVTST